MPTLNERATPGMPVKSALKGIQEKMETFTRREEATIEKQHIKRQVEAEAAFGEALETQGVDPVQFMKKWKLSHHQFNTLAHYIHGVNDEEPDLPTELTALLFALRASRAA